ncbi:MAG: hypothetical protein HQL70_11205 [Magnetococcales bacterium]|nr:hypothetical protein [Magnetococcales bacterium]
MATETMMFKIGAGQSAQLSGLAGKSYVASKVSTAGTGLSKMFFLTPVDAGGKSVGLKIEGTRQVAEMTSLAGKTITIGKSPTMIGATGNWLVVNTGSAGAATTGAAATGAALKGKAAASTPFLMELEGANQGAQLKAMSGKSFTVIKSPLGAANAKSWLFMKPAGAATSEKMVALQIQNGAGNFSGLVGKTFTVGKAPIVAGNGAGNWILLQPSTGAVAKTTASVAAASKSKGAISSVKAAKSATIAKEAGTVVKSGTTAIAGKSSTVAAASSGSGVIWNGTGWKLGLGLGLGGWGPVLLAGVVVASGVGIYSYLKQDDDGEES